jgi:hypothetical protein
MAAEVYRSVDADGTVTYSDRPESDHAQLVHVATEAPVSRPPSPQGRNSESSSAAADTPSGDGDTSQAPAEPQQTAAEKAEEKQKNCKIARERVERYANAHRLYRKTPDGEREYLSDAEIDAARARAAADVETWCN